MNKQPTPMTRRQVLKTLILGGGAVAAAGVAGQTVAAPAGQAPEAREDGYRETEHIRNYYATLRN